MWTSTVPQETVQPGHPTVKLTFSKLEHHNKLESNQFRSIQRLKITKYLMKTSTIKDTSKENKQKKELEEKRDNK